MVVNSFFFIRKGRQASMLNPRRVNSPMIRKGRGVIFHNQGNGLLLFHQKRSLHVKFYRPKFHGTRRSDSRFYPAARRSAQGLSCGSIHLSDHLIHRASRRDHRQYVVIGRNAAVNHHRLFEIKGLLQCFFHLAVSAMILPSIPKAFARAAKSVFRRGSVWENRRP